MTSSDWMTAFKRVTITGVMAGVVILAINFVLGMQEALSDSATPDFVLTIFAWLWVACLLIVLIGVTGWLLSWLKTEL